MWPLLLLMGAPTVSGQFERIRPIQPALLWLTQSVTGENGNCWQTSVACILRVDPETLPDQATIERVTGKDENGKIVRAGTYNNPLQAYLREHHAMTLVQLWDTHLACVRVTSMNGYHLAYGPSERTPQLGVDHVVVAHEGKTVWDPHPSRAGITKATSWGAFAPWPPDRDMTWHRDKNPCVCPRCSDGK